MFQSCRLSGRAEEIVQLEICTGDGSVADGCYHTVGLKRDGTVVAVGGNDDSRCDVSYRMNIVAIAAGAQHTVGLRQDGLVVAVGRNSSDECDASSWRDIGCTLALE